MTSRLATEMTADVIVTAATEGPKISASLSAAALRHVYTRYGIDLSEDLLV